MLKKIINWLTGKVEMPEPVDTSPVQFQTWLNEQIGKALRGGDTYYAVCIVGQNRLPNIGGELKVWPSVREAEAKRYDLQKVNPDRRLHVRRVRIMYSFTDM